MLAQKGEHTRASCKQRHIKTTTREATHLDANGALIESARMPGIVGEVWPAAGFVDRQLS